VSSAKGDVALDEAASVVDLNGENVGRGLELITDRDSGRITYLVIQAGHLWGKHAKAVPINWVATFGEGEVALTVGVKTLESVPANQPT
jgi:uncharacterized protein YrrD